MKIIKALCLVIIVLIISVALFDLFDWEFYVVNALIGLYTGIVYGKDTE